MDGLEPPAAASVKTGKHDKFLVSLTTLTVAAPGSPAWLCACCGRGSPVTRDSAIEKSILHDEMFDASRLRTTARGRWAKMLGLLLQPYDTNVHLTLLLRANAGLSCFVEQARKMPMSQSSPQSLCTFHETVCSTERRMISAVRR